jgi:hypothetical protein
MLITAKSQTLGKCNDAVTTSRHLGLEARATNTLHPLVIRVICTYIPTRQTACCRKNATKPPTTHFFLDVPPRLKYKELKQRR